MPTSPSSSASSTQAPSDIESFYRAIYSSAFKVAHSTGSSNPLRSWEAGASDQYYGAVCAYVWSLPIQQFWEKQGLYTTGSVPGGKPINEFYNAKKIDQDDTIVSPNTEVLYSNAFIDVSTSVVEVSYPISPDVYTLVEVLDPYTNVQFSDGSAYTNSDSSQTASKVFYWANASEDIIDYVAEKFPDAIALQSPQAWVLGRVEVDPYQNPNASAAASTPYQSENPNSSLALSSIQTLNDEFSICIPYPTSNCAVSTSSAGPATSQVTNQNASSSYEEYFDQVAQAVNSNSTYIFYSGTTNGQLNSGGELYDQSSMFGNFGGNGTYSIGLTASGFNGTGSDIEQGFSDAQSAVNLISQNSSASDTSHYWSINTTLGQYQPSSSGWVTAAAAASVGLGANVAGDGTYPQTTQDSTGSSLSTSEDYLIDFSATGLPPIDDPGFWSATVYDSNNNLVSASSYSSSETYYLSQSSSDATAATGVYALGSAQLSYLNTSNISLTLSPTTPANQQFWIPTPSSGSTFSVVLRLYNPVPASSTANASILSSSNPWQPPGIELLSTTTNGRLSGSLVYLDTDGNLTLSANEKSVTTNVDGQFVKRSLEGSGTLVLEGGKEATTGASYKGKLFALQGSEVISPLSTLDWGMERAGISEDTRRSVIQAITLGAYKYLNGGSLAREELEHIDPKMIAPHQVARLDLPYSDELAKATSLVDSALGLFLGRVYESLEPFIGAVGTASPLLMRKYPEIVVRTSALIANSVIKESVDQSFGPFNSVASVPTLSGVSQSAADISIATDLGRIAAFALSISSEPYETFSKKLSRFKAAELSNDGAYSIFPLPTDSSFTDRFGLARFYRDSITGYPDAGLAARNTNPFRSVMQADFIRPGGATINARDQSSRALRWDVIGADEGSYIENLTNLNANFNFEPAISFGQEHLKEFDYNSFGFDNLLDTLTT